MRDSAPAKDINHPRLGTSEFLKIKPTKSTVITVQIHGTRILSTSKFMTRFIFDSFRHEERCRRTDEILNFRFRFVAFVLGR
jgi:hypothetical protein